MIRSWFLQPAIEAINSFHGPVKIGISLLEKVIMNQAELAQALTDAADQAAKAKGEILEKIQDLEDAVGNAGTVTPEVEAALAALRGQVQGLDDVVPDAPVEPPAEPTDTATDVGGTDTLTP